MDPDWNRMETVEQAYRQGVRYLEQQGVESPHFISELLLREVLGWDRTRLFTRFCEPLASESARRFALWLKQKAEGVPVQYLTGEQEFFGRPFRVGSSVLIPRPETEGLVETVLQKADQIWGGKPVSAVDVGTGSGAVAVTLAAERPRWEIYAVDRSREALQVARENGKRNGTGPIQWWQGDWLGPLLERGIQVDLVVSNPPYIPTGAISHLDPEVKDHEPRMALDGGEDGIDPYRILMRQIPRVLKMPGFVAFEVGVGQQDTVKSLLLQGLERAQVTCLPDLAGRPRVVVAQVGVE